MNANQTADKPAMPELPSEAAVSGIALLADWSRISKEARETMAMLGDFGPTFNADNREVKGYPQEQGKTYWSSNELRKMSTHLTEVAEWLDTRAAKSANASISTQ